MNDLNNLSLDAWQTSLEAAIANTLSSSTAMKNHLNDELIKRYNSQFDSWKVMVEAGKIDNKTPPNPPNGYMLIVVENGFSYPDLSESPVCPSRTDIPEDRSKPAVSVLPEPTSVRNVPFGDNMPVGYIATAPDGSRWQKQSSATPFGIAYFYAKL